MQIQMSFIGSKNLKFYGQSYATKVCSKTKCTKLKNPCCPPTIPRITAGQILQKKHRTSGTRTPRPQNHNPPTFQTPGDRRKRAHLPGDLQHPKPRNDTPAIADHLHEKTTKLALFNIKLLLKKEDNILHIPNELN